MKNKLHSAAATTLTLLLIGYLTAGNAFATDKTPGDSYPQRPKMSDAEQKKYLSAVVKTLPGTDTSPFDKFSSYTKKLADNNEPYLITLNDSIFPKTIRNPFMFGYKPTYADLFDSIARQTSATVSYREDIASKFLLAPPAMPLPYEIKVPEDWKDANMGPIVKYNAPSQASVTMGTLAINMLGNYSKLASDKEESTRKAIAEFFIKLVQATDAAVPNMTTVKVDGSDALFCQAKTKNGAAWRQWVLIKNKQPFLITSEIDTAEDEALAPKVQAAVDSFHIKDSK